MYVGLFTMADVSLMCMLGYDRRNTFCSALYVGKVKLCSNLVVEEIPNPAPYVQEIKRTNAK